MPVQRAAITGAPGAGKSTLLAELSRRGVATVSEVARTILKSAGGMALREEDPLAFADAMLSAQLAAWDDTQIEGSVVFDRGFPDIAGFLRVEGLPISDETTRACDEYRFEGRSFAHRHGARSTRPTRSGFRIGKKPLPATGPCVRPGATMAMR
jgi:predicted ATPase|tara:strand:+ start:212 stop:673 length:462 start_codon:yes stop_codon:yes gene_type:complete